VEGIAALMNSSGISGIDPALVPAGVRMVHSFDELASFQWRDGINALCWPRVLPGDFGEIVAALRPGPGITAVDEKTLAALSLSPAGAAARRMLLADLAMLTDAGLDPLLETVHGYTGHREGDPFPTHVQSFHADSADGPADTWLCTYFGRSSEGIPNASVTCRPQLAAVRAALLGEFGGAEGADFEEFLHGHFHDLHYVPAEGAIPWTFGIGNLWRIACDWPGCPVPPCVHRAPLTEPGDPPRLLLIS
jgi:hypothetical protein